MIDDPKQGPLDHLLSETESREILLALHRAGGDRTQAAKLLSLAWGVDD